MRSDLEISVVTPSYNQGKFLAETIESVIGQQGKFSLDYLIIDGGSTDGSVEIIRHYQELLQKGAWRAGCRAIRYRWLSEKDRGQTDAILKGFAMATGGLLAWLNSDDVYLPGALEAAATYFRDQPGTGLLYGDAEYCDAQGTVIGRYRTEPFDFERLALFNFICQPSTFFRREAFQAVGELDRSLHFAMDYDLWVRLGRRFPCGYLPQFLSRYRLHETSKTIRVETLYENSEEALRLAIKHFGWAPLNRIYTSCRALCQARLPGIISRTRPGLVVASVLCSVLRSLQLNGGVRSKDLALLNRENFSKLSKSRTEIMTGRKD
jgi:glycosyltransferase involved in cell wall biosynthesis